MNVDNLKHEKHIGYKCICCQKELGENERQQIISLKFWQTWCLLCAFKKNTNDKHLENYIISNGVNSLIIDKIKLLYS